MGKAVAFALQMKMKSNSARLFPPASCLVMLSKIVDVPTVSPSIDNKATHPIRRRTQGVTSHERYAPSARLHMKLLVG